MRAMWMVALAIAGGCNGESSKATKPPPESATSVQDALWALSPQRATFGVVFSPNGLGQLERALAATEKVFASRPALAPIRELVVTRVEELLGARSFLLGAHGMTAEKGYALFWTPSDETIALFPVVDRDKFLKARNGTEGADGVDKFADWTCKKVKAVYACATAPVLFDQLGSGNLGVTLGITNVRGDIEVAGFVPMIGTAIAAVAQVEPGAITIHAAAKNLPERSRKLFVNAKLRLAGDKTAAFGVLGVGPWEFLDTLPREPLVEDISLKMLAQSFEGPATLTTEIGASMFEVQVPLRDAQPAQRLVARCPEIAILAQLGATSKDGTCHVAIPQLALEVDVSVDGKTLHVGKQGQAVTATAVPLTPLAQELASGEWALAFWGRGTHFGPSQFAVGDVAAGDLADAMGLVSLLPRHAAGLIDEYGLGLRLEGDVLRGVVGIRTIWANPDDVIAKVLSLDPMAARQPASLAQAKAIADAAPSSPFAIDYRIGSTGLATTVAMGLTFARLGIPAFFESLKIKKTEDADQERSEIEVQLERLGVNAGTAYAAKRSFPKGKIGPTPARTCCGTGNNKCAPDPAAWSAPLWKALQFDMTGPHQYRYAYESDGKTFTATARSDLDCNGDEAIWTMTGKINASGKPQVEVARPARGHF